MSLFQRVLNYLANEIIVKSLANSPAFQRLAMRTHLSLKELQQKGLQTAKLTQTDFAKQSQEITSRFGTFTKTLRNNLQKEWEELQKQQSQKK